MPGGEALAALAVPARYAILSHLLDVGPRTASECAEVVGESPSNCSWHLRALARVGLVEPAPAAGGDARRRPWQATAVGFDLSGGDGPAGDVAAAALASIAARRDADLLRRHLERRPHLPPEWAGADNAYGYTLQLTADELAGLLETIDALVRPLIARVRTGAPVASELVHLSLRAFLHPDAPPPGR